MNILIVDDHPMTVDGYIRVLSENPFGSYEPEFTKVNNCEEAYFAILRSVAFEQSFDLAIIDKRLPSYEEKSILSGSDLILLLREKIPKCKTIIATAHTEVITIYDIVKKVRPDGLIIKNDVTADILQKAVEEIIQGKQYHSHTVKNCIKEIWKKELMIDDYNRQILFYLSEGFKIKELEAMICLTTSTIQKRISQMKKVFETLDDSGLVKEAIKQKFI
jgi:DNA-binding NarL/FixJ family response regulator